MSSWWFSSLLVVTLLISMANSKFDLDSPVRLARCRASCLYKMQVVKMTDLDCRSSFNCSQCWEACELVRNWRSRCTQADCGEGCLEACRFYSLSPSHLAPVSMEEALVWRDFKVSWLPVSRSLGVVVYVVMSDRSQLCQTLESRVTIPSNADPARVRVLVVDWRGLVKVLSYGGKSPIVQAVEILRSVGMETTGLMTHQEEERIQFTNFLKPPKVTLFRPWWLKVVSLQHQSSLVLAEISWRPYRHHTVTNRQLIVTYLVTWSLDSDVLRGNLLTNSSTVTLSLLPECVYVIQVALLSVESASVRSERLVLDTSHSSANPPNMSPGQPGQRNTSRPPSTQTFNGRLNQTDSYIQIRTPIHRQEEERLREVIAVVLVLLGVILTTAWRWRYRLSLSHEKLMNERSESDSLNKVLPPAERIAGNLLVSKTNFS